MATTKIRLVLYSIKIYLEPENKAWAKSSSQNYIQKPKFLVPLVATQPSKLIINT